MLIGRNNLVWLILVLPLFCLVAGAAGAEPDVGWELDLANPSIKDSFTEMCFVDKQSGAKMQERYSVAVADGVLKITGNYQREGDCVRVLIKLPDGADLLRHPVFEVEWRKDCPGGRLFIGAIRQTLEGKETSSYYYVNTEYAGMAVDQDDLHVLSRSGDRRAKSAHDGNTGIAGQPFRPRISPGSLHAEPSAATLFPWWRCG